MTDGRLFPDDTDAHTLVANAAGDRVRGSRAIAHDAADGLAALAAECPDPEQFAPAFLSAARALLVGQPAMAALWRLVNDCLLAADEAVGPEWAADAVHDAARTFQLRLRRAAKALTHELAAFVPEHATVVTVSASSTLEESFAELATGGGLGRLLVLRSLPGAEGARMADRLRSRRVRAEIIDDAAMGPAVAAADLVVVGADAVSAAWCLNKVGTRPLALVAQALGVPAIVCADTSKAVPSPIAAVIAARTANDAHTALVERTPWRELRGWLCEDGMLTASSVDVITGEIPLHPRLRLLADDLTPPPSFT